MTAARPRQQPGGQQLSLAQQRVPARRPAWPAGWPASAPPPAIHRGRRVWQRSAGSSLIVVRPKPHSAACTGSTGSPDSVATARSVTIHRPPGSFTLPSTALHGVHGAEQVGDLGLEPRRRLRRSTPGRSARCCARRRRRTADRARAACANSCPNSSGSVFRSNGMQPGTVGGQFVESGDQPGAVRASGTRVTAGAGGGTSCQPRV